MMEPYDEIVEPLILKMSSDEEKYFEIPCDRTVHELRNILENYYNEILRIDFKKENNQNFWFISKNKEEPRYQTGI